MYKSQLCIGKINKLVDNFNLLTYLCPCMYPSGNPFVYHLTYLFTLDHAANGFDYIVMLLMLT